MNFFANIAAKLGFGAGDNRVQNALGDRSNLTVDELANLIGGGFTSSSGAVVSEATAMRVSAVYACVALIAGAISTLPITVYQRTAKGREAVDHPCWWLLNEQPDSEISAAVFWEYMVSARLFYGDCYAEIVRPSYRSSSVTGLKAHHPLRVQPFRDAAGELFYRITPLVGAQYVLSPADILHIPSLGYDGLTSLSPITYAAQQSVGTSIATAEYNAKFFANGARPDFILQTDGSLNKEQAELIRSTWTNRHGGASNAHIPAVLTGGLKAQPLTLNAVDSQILQTANWNLEEVCRILGVPPFMVGSTEKSTSWGTGQENMGRGFVKYTLLRDLVKIQKEINRKFWPTRETYFVEFDVSGIERGDLKSENEALRVALGRAGEPGWLTVNEVRHLKLLKPIEGGDTIMQAIAPNDPAQEKAADQKQQDQKAAAKAHLDRLDTILAREAPQPVINVAAPIVNLTVPEQTAPVVNVTNQVPEQAAPTVNVTNNVPEAVVHNTVNVPETVINVEAVMPAQAAPVVNNTVNMPDSFAIASMPERETTTQIVRDGSGSIIKSTQTERDA